MFLKRISQITVCAVTIFAANFSQAMQLDKDFEKFVVGCMFQAGGGRFSLEICKEYTAKLLNQRLEGVSFSVNDQMVLIEIAFANKTVECDMNDQNSLAQLEKRMIALHGVVHADVMKAVILRTFKVLYSHYLVGKILHNRYLVESYSDEFLKQMASLLELMRIRVSFPNYSSKTSLIEKLIKKHLQDIEKKNN